MRLKVGRLYRYKLADFKVWHDVTFVVFHVERNSALCLCLGGFLHSARNDMTGLVDRFNSGCHIDLNAREVPDLSHLKS